MAVPLLVVDVQIGFLNEFTRHIPSRIARLIEDSDYDPVLFTRFINRPGGPYRRFLDWHACAAEPEISIAPELQPMAVPERVFTKAGFTGIPNDLRTYLRDNDIQRLNIAGIDTDMCVLKVAMDTFDAGIEPVVLIDCCASTAGLQAHLAGLAVLSRNIGALRLHDAGLNDGLLGAPR